MEDLLIAFVCPKCGKKFRKLRPFGSGFGSPVGRCPECGADFLDTRLREPALEDPPDYVAKPGRHLLSAAAVGAAGGFCAWRGAVLLGSRPPGVSAHYVHFTPYLLMLLGAAFLAAGVWEIADTASGFRARRYARARAESAARLKSRGYARRLAALGAAVPAEYLAREAPAGEVPAGKAGTGRGAAAPGAAPAAAEPGPPPGAGPASPRWFRSWAAFLLLAGVLAAAAGLYRLYGRNGPVTVEIGGAAPLLKIEHSLRNGLIPAGTDYYYAGLGAADGAVYPILADPDWLAATFPAGSGGSAAVTGLPADPGRAVSREIGARLAALGNAPRPLGDKCLDVLYKEKARKIAGGGGVLTLLGIAAFAAGRRGHTRAGARAFVWILIAGLALILYLARAAGIA